MGTAEGEGEGLEFTEPVGQTVTEWEPVLDRVVLLLRVVVSDMEELTQAEGLLVLKPVLH